jgi:hypothetical protein
VSGHKGQCGALSAQKQYIATTAAAAATATASAKQQAPQKTAAPQPQPSLKKSTNEATNAAPSLFSPTQRTPTRTPHTAHNVARAHWADSLWAPTVAMTLQ